MPIFDTVKFMIDTGINPDEGVSTKIITFNRELRKNIPNDKCRQGEMEKGLSTCLDDFMTKQIGCQVPWINNSIDNRSQLKLCLNMSKLSEALNFWNKVSFTAAKINAKSIFSYLPLDFTI